MVNAHIESLLILAEPFSKPGKFKFIAETTKNVKKHIPVMLRERLSPPPDESYSIHRKLSGMFLLCQRFNAEIDCYKIFQDILKLKGVV